MKVKNKIKFHHCELSKKAWQSSLDKRTRQRSHLPSPAFTIVELLVIIVVIAILAAITIVSYTNITARANTSSVKSTLSQSIKGLEAYKEGISTTETYPSATAFSALNIAKNSNNISYTYYPSDTSDTPSSYCLEGTTNNTTFSISSTNEVVVNKPCTENSLVGWWKLNGDATDSSGNGNNGNIYGATAAVGEDDITSHAMSFDGVDDYIGINSIAAQENITYSLWFKTDVLTSTNSCLLSARANSWHGRGIIIRYSAAYVWTRDVDRVWREASDGNFSSSAWTNLILVQSGSTLKGYFNGAYKSQTSYIGYINDYDGYYEIGNYTNSDYFFDGFIDDVRIYNRALSASEVQSLYNQGAQ